MTAQLDCITNIHVLEAVLEAYPHRIRCVECSVDHSFDAELDGIMSQYGIHFKRLSSVKGWRAWCDPIEPLSDGWLSGAIKEGNCNKIMILDGVTDPHNMGACLRSCAGFSVGAVVVAKHHSVRVNDTVRNVSCGGAEHVPVVYTQNVVRCLRKLKDEGFWVYGSCESGQTGLSKTDFHSKSVLILGSEGRGMRKGIREACDVLFSIETQSDFSCLNVSVAAGICLYEWGRPR
jgi:23S rRNA (guanosine2251-2'-O)-methyltransferase